MALEKCEDCGGVISETAEVCPHCGAIYEEKSSVFTQVFWAIILASVLLCILAALFLFLVRDLLRIS